MALDRQTIEIPLAAGLDTRADTRALQPPALASCTNAVFTETGGIQKRRPYTALSTNLLPSGTISNIRRLATYEDELLAFTKDTLYSWSPAVSKWSPRGTYLAPKVTERTVFARPGDQHRGARAELANVVFYAWEENSDTYLAATDKTSGAVLLAPVLLDVGGGHQTPRFQALTDKVLLFTQDGNLVVRALTPSTISAYDNTVAATEVAVAGEFDSSFDVAKLSATSAVVVWRRDVNTSYGIASVNEGLTVVASTKARTADGPVAVAVTADLTTAVAVIRSSGASILGDILSVALADVAVSTAVGAMSGTTPPAGLTGAFRSVADAGVFRCYVWFRESATDATSELSTSVSTNYITSVGVAGTETDSALRRLYPASKAFDHDGRVFVWLVFAGATPDSGMVGDKGSQLQNTYFLYRDDGLLIAKAAATTAGGLLSAGLVLPLVASSGTNKYTFLGTERRIVPLGQGGQGYSDRGPRDIEIEFDSNEARRVVQLGKTAYLTGGQILQYDGAGLTEVGFHIYPWYFDVVDDGAGNLADGTYTYKLTWAWSNAKGELDRSTTATFADVTVAGGGSDTAWDAAPLHTTLKTGARGEVNAEVWRTLVAPTLESPFYLVTSKDPSAVTPNGYYPNTPAAAFLGTHRDNFADSTLDDKEASPENGGLLESISPPPATVIAVNEHRVFLAGISYDPYLIWYSKQRGEGEVVAFHDALTIRVPPAGGPVTAMAFLNETLIVFQGAAVYALPGDGFDNFGGGANFGPARLLSSDIGATTADTVCVTPQGIVFFSSKGWYLLDRALSLQFLGAPVEDYNTDTFVAVHLLEKEHQIRCVSTSRILMFDYLVSQWSRWEISGPVHAALWSGDYYYTTAASVFKEDATHGGTTGYSLEIETPWIKLAGLQGFQRIRRVMILGEYRSAHRLKVELARDYGLSYFQTKFWTVTPTTVGAGEQVRHSPSIQKCEAIKIRITDRDTTTDTAPSGEGLKLTNLALELGLRQGLHKGLAAARKQ